MHGNTHVRNHDYIDHNRQAKQHTVLSSSHSCCKYHKTLLLVQLDMCLLLFVHIAQTRGFDPTHFSIHVPTCSSNPLTHAVACSVLDNIKELPVNMANHMANFTSQLFSHLSDQMNVAGVQEVSCDARTIADTAHQ